MKYSTLKPSTKPMKRTAFKSRTKPMARCSIAKGKAPARMKSTKPAATAAEQAHMDQVARMGCILCRLAYGKSHVAARVHHLRTGQGRKRAPHRWTMPLCPPHHDKNDIGAAGSPLIGQGLHDMGRAQFEKLHGISEVQLLIATQITLIGRADADLYELDKRYSIAPIVGELVWLR